MVPLTLACGNYDRTRAIMDGRVRIEGCEINYISLEPEEVFFRAARYQDFDVAELSFNSYILQTSRNESHYIGIPAFVSRCFRHSMLPPMPSDSPSKTRSAASASDIVFERRLRSRRATASRNSVYGRTPSILAIGVRLALSAANPGGVFGTC